MKLAMIVAARQHADARTGGEVGSSDGPMLSVAEVQTAMRALRAAKLRKPDDRTEDLTDVAAVVAAAIGADHPAATATRRHANERAGGHNTDVLGARRVSVVAAHSGAGASTVALAIAEAAGERATHLIELSAPSRSGLVAAASAELGADLTGGWRRGSRGPITIDRRAADGDGLRWPAPIAADPSEVLVVADVGLAVDKRWTAVEVAEFGAVVVVCRPTVPGIRLAEQLLGHLGGAPAGVAVVGGDKWPREVRAGTGPLLAAMRSSGRVVPVPPDRHLEVNGLTNAPLPPKVGAAGRRLLVLVDAAHQGAVATEAAPLASRTEGTTQ